jgi:hypothetical protein
MLVSRCIQVAITTLPILRTLTVVQPIIIISGGSIDDCALLPSIDPFAEMTALPQRR